jgi:hypothetical protein
LKEAVGALDPAPRPSEPAGAIPLWGKCDACSALMNVEGVDGVCGTLVSWLDTGDAC